MPGDESKYAGVRKDIAEVIERAFPNGIVEMPDNYDDTWLAKVYPRLKKQLSEIENATLLYERKPEAELPDGPEWEGEAVPEKDPEILEKPADMDWGDFSSSYHLFFVALTDEDFKFECEDLRYDENDTRVGTAEGIGRIGCAVGVSLIAPFAVITLNSQEDYEDGEVFYPDIEFGVFELDGTPRDPDVHFREMFEEEGVAALHALRDKVAGILHSLGVEVLSDEILKTVVPGLRAGASTNLDQALRGGHLAVKDALFYRGD